MSEAVELLKRQAVAAAGVGTAKPEERIGRQTGSVEWRTQRGETGLDNAKRSIALLASDDGSAVTLRCPMRGEDSPAGASGLVAEIIGDAPEAAVAERLAVDIRVENSYIEMSQEACATFEGVGSFTMEAWVSCDDGALSTELHNNPLISKHGVGSGIELRLGRSGSVCFLITVDGEHVEVSGQAAGAEASSEAGWRHVAGVYDAERGVLQAWSGMACVGEAAVPPGALSPFDGPLNIGASVCCVSTSLHHAYVNTNVNVVSVPWLALARAAGRNPQWTERHCACYLAGVRLARGALAPGAFLQLGSLPGAPACE